MNVTTSHLVIYPSMLIFVPLGGSLFALLCSFTFFHTFYGGATSFFFLSFFGHFFLVSSLPLPHTALLDSLTLQTYFLLSFLSSSALLCFYTFGQDIQTSHSICTTSLLFLLVLPLIW